MPDGRLVHFQKRLRFHIKHPHGIGIAVEQQPVLPLAVAQFLLRAPAVGNVADTDHHAADFRVVQPVFADGFKLQPLAVLVFIANLGFDRAFGVVQREFEATPARAANPRHEPA